MKKKDLFIMITFFTALFSYKNVYAFDDNNYKERDLCGNFEVAGFHADGSINQVGCYGTFDEAKTFMKNNGANDLAIMTKVNGNTKIVDANQALVDLTEGPNQLTYYYLEDSLSSRKYTYMFNHGSYRGGDAGLIDTSFSSTSKIYMAKVELADFTGWVPQDDYEIVPITWVKSASNYTVSNETISHNLITRVQDDPSYYSLAIGPKPTMLKTGTYYSYDGHYFYKDLSKMIVDYKNNTRVNSENKDEPYYNYYMYLSNHTKTTYSSVTIDEYIRNVLGYKKNIYGFSFDGTLNGEYYTATSGASRLYGSGTFFYYAQEKYGVNALLSLSLSRNETGNGRSYLAVVKNNGFGLEAVDSNPINGAKSYGSFPSSILGYASKWITYGYAHPRDWRYFGPQFGNKWIGMNVQYASDAYWSENMANHYYNFDKTYGLQDYNYYQLGVLKKPSWTYSEPSTSSKKIYEYPEAEDAVVIVDEVTRNGEKWYKVVSDLNIDSNYNEISFSGNYNWNGYVYVKAADVTKINQGKNGYISPNQVTEYQNKNYEYDLYVEDGVMKPKVAITTKNTPYYYDSSLTSKTGSTLLKDRYVMVYTVATLNNKPVAYLVTSDYWHDQKEWISADSIKFTNTTYGQIHNNYTSNMYSWVNYNREDKEYSKISGLYEYTYFPVLEQSTVGEDTWLKVPVSLTTNDNIYGYTLKKYKNEIWIDLSTSVVENQKPIINAVDKTIIEGTAFDPKKDVSATDAEDGNITNKIEVTKNDVNINKAGTYEVSYKVKDSADLETTLTIKVTVVANEAPVINASNKEITINTVFDPKKDVTATDKEDGNLTDSIVVKTNTVKVTTLGTYKVVYEVTDKNNKTTTKEITVTVVKDRSPIINASDKTILINEEFDPYEDVTATDPEDGNITKKVKVTQSTVDTKKVGKYQVTYQVTDTSQNTVTKTINVEVVDLDSMISESLFYFDYLKEVNGKLELKGYNTIKGINNTLDTEIEYMLVLVDIKTEESYPLEMTRITNKSEITRPVNSTDDYDYTYSWFKGAIDTKDIPDGDYQMIILSATSNKIAGSVVSNKLLRTQASSFKDAKYITTRNNYFEDDIPLELIIRSKQIGNKTATSKYNQYNQFRTLEFTNNKLHLKGTSYSYGMNLAESASVERKIIFENTSTYEQYSYNIGSITKGLYEVGTTLDDKLSKTRAWYDSTVDISAIPKGNYAIYISNKANISDYGELSELLQRDLSNITAKINNKTYSFSVNKALRYRIELNVN